MVKKTSPRRGADGDYSLEAVPAKARRGFWSMFVVMMGFTFFSASMSVILPFPSSPQLAPTMAFTIFVTSKPRDSQPKGFAFSRANNESAFGTQIL